MPTAADWLTAANPFHRARTQAEALRQARVGTVALTIMAVSNALGALWAYLHRDEMVEAMTRAMADQGAAAQGMMSGAQTFTIALTVVFAAVYAILAMVQWQRPTHWIPVILLVVTAWGLVSILNYLLFPNPAMPEVSDLRPVIPMWRTVAGYTEQLITAVLLIASWRGAYALKTRFPPSDTDEAA